MLERIMRSLFIQLSKSRTAERALKAVGARTGISRMFVPGEEAPAALASVRQLNRDGISATLDILGEAVSDAAQARAFTARYLELIDAIAADRLDANVSLKLTMLGLDIDPALAFENLRSVVERARERGSFVRIDMEDSPYTEATIEITRRLKLEFGYNNVGTVLQSYLLRTRDDARRLCEDGITVRLCKGAYREPPEVAFQDKAEVDRNYLETARLLLASGLYHGLATHDERIIEELIGWTKGQGIGPERFEFQMLYGIRRDLWHALVRRGFRVRIYTPFGREWFRYYMRRLAERPANVWFVLRNVVIGLVRR